jgi:hypothetical protein
VTQVSDDEPEYKEIKYSEEHDRPHNGINSLGETPGPYSEAGDWEEPEHGIGHALNRISSLAENAGIAKRDMDYADGLAQEDLEEKQIAYYHKITELVGYVTNQCAGGEKFIPPYIRDLARKRGL